jgi:hypothetical protein
MTVTLSSGLELSRNDVDVKVITNSNYSSLVEVDTVLLLKTRLSKPLNDDGFVRDFVRHVQRARKELEMKLDTKVSVRINAPSKVWSVLTQYKEYVWNETQTTHWVNLNSTYFDTNDPEVKRVKYKNDKNDQEVLFSLVPLENLVEV